MDITSLQLSVVAFCNIYIHINIHTHINTKSAASKVSHRKQHCHYLSTPTMKTSLKVICTDKFPSVHHKQSFFEMREHFTLADKEAYD